MGKGGLFENRSGEGRSKEGERRTLNEVYQISIKIIFFCVRNRISQVGRRERGLVFQAWMGALIEREAWGQRSAIFDDEHSSYQCSRGPIRKGERGRGKVEE